MRLAATFLLAACLATVPARFTLQARNPARNLVLGGGFCVYASVGGPAYVMCNDKGRRDGTYAEMWALQQAEEDDSTAEPATA